MTVQRLLALGGEGGKSATLDVVVGSARDGVKKSLKLAPDYCSSIGLGRAIGELADELKQSSSDVWIRHSVPARLFDRGLHQAGKLVGAQDHPEGILIIYQRDRLRREVVEFSENRREVAESVYRCRRVIDPR